MSVSSISAHNVVFYHLSEDTEAVVELVRAPGPHVGHRAGHLGGEEAAQ